MRNIISDKYKNFVKLLNFSQGKYRVTDVFKDFVIMFAIAIKNSCYYEKEDEDIYLQTINKYKKEEIEIFPKITNELINIYMNKKEIEDVLGEIFEQIGAASKRNEQYFTPKHVAKFMSKMHLNKIDFKEKDFITINDPACGSGVLLLSFVNELEENHIDYTRKAFFVGQDIDFICCCMAYIQASLHRVAAAIVWGNTLTNERNKIFYTPEYFIGNWNEKLNKK